MAETRFHTLLKKKILEEVENAKERLAAGQIPVEGYRQEVGLILGLKTALDLAEEIERSFD